MRRQDIQLLAAARQGSAAACCEVGRRYLLGTDGFPRHAQTALDYLNRPAVRESGCAVGAIADGLPLHEALELGQLDLLKQAARSGHPAALCKLGAWHLTRPGGLQEAQRCLQLAAGAGSDAARQVLRQHHGDAPDIAIAATLTERLGSCGAIDAPAVLSRVLQRACATQDLDGLHWCLGLAARWRRLHCPLAAERLVDAVELAERHAHMLDELPIDFVLEALERRSQQADARAQFALGRLLCGLPCGLLQPRRGERSLNLRKGVALLLRSADAGELRAWVHLHRLSADHRSSVANPQMARYFLEKAAAGGDAASQRRLGALQLREAASIDDSERALAWLHRAAGHGDVHAIRLLRSLVLHVPGADAQAHEAIAVIGRSSPWLAARLEVSRHFGLTRLEALAMDPVPGQRPWGLVVGPNRFVRKARLAAPRAVPALGEQAMGSLQAAVRMFATPDREELPRRRVRLLRDLCARHGIDDSLFFATATADDLATLRSGGRWAFRQREALRDALSLSD